MKVQCDLTVPRCTTLVQPLHAGCVKSTVLLQVSSYGPSCLPARIQLTLHSSSWAQQLHPIWPSKVVSESNLTTNLENTITMISRSTRAVKTDCQSLPKRINCNASIYRSMIMHPKPWTSPWGEAATAARIPKSKMASFMLHLF